MNNKKINLPLKRTNKKRLCLTKKMISVFNEQHFSLYTVKPLISLVLLPISKVYQIRSFLKLLVSPIFLIKSEGKRGLNEKKLLCKISKIHEEYLPH